MQTKRELDDASSSKVGDRISKHPKRDHHHQTSPPHEQPDAPDVIDLTASPEPQQQQQQLQQQPVPPPMHLLRVRGIPEWANQGFLGATLSSLIPAPSALALSHTPSPHYVLISNYMIDFAWLLSACPAIATADKIVIVHGERSGQAIVHDVMLSSVSLKTTVHRPPTPEWGTHHSKYFLVQYSTGVRVIIHTANLIYVDANNKSQGVYYQDFPLKGTDGTKEGDSRGAEPSPFELDLLVYLQGLKLPASEFSVLESIVKSHDFSSARVHLIASIPSQPGQFGGPQEMHRFGHMKLRHCLSKYRYKRKKEKRCAYIAQYSSIGSLSIKWLDEFVASVTAADADVAPRRALALVYPTVDEVKDSLEGFYAGGSIPGYPDKVNRPFLMESYHRWGGDVCGRQRAMPHIKSYCCYYYTNNDDAVEVEWFYLTSSNLSKAAHGELQNSKVHARQLLRIRSYELGVLYTPDMELAYRRHKHCGFSVFHASPGSRNDDSRDDVQTHRKDINAVRFVQWQRGQSQGAVVEDGQTGECVVPLPIPYRLPPMLYTSDTSVNDTPWSIQAWPGVDCLGHAYPGVGAHYGLDDGMEWGDIVSLLQQHGGGGGGGG